MIGWIIVAVVVVVAAVAGFKAGRRRRAAHRLVILPADQGLSAASRREVEQISVAAVRRADRNRTRS